LEGAYWNVRINAGPQKSRDPQADQGLNRALDLRQSCNAAVDAALAQGEGLFE
jgi:hypothetical protein